MAKIAQLIEAGDYLVYKGDYVTNTAYNVNDVVTWEDGNLYEVIKAHTSSATLNPDNAEYYKAMTASKYISHEYTTANKLYNEFINKCTSIEYIEVYVNGGGDSAYIFGRPSKTNLLGFGKIELYSNDGQTREEMVNIYQNEWMFIYNEVAINGTKTKHTFTIKKIIVYTK